MSAKSTRVVRVCEHCGSQFTAKAYEAGLGNARFCSGSCRNFSRYTPMPDRFWESVKKTNGCWIWVGFTNSRGYGVLTLDGRQVGAHRVSWELRNGTITDGLFVLHRCDNPPCVNPDHLFLGTNQENIADRDTKGRCQHGDSHCRAKMNASIVVSIRARYATGDVSMKELAIEYGVHESSIWSAIVGKTWKHIPVQ